MILINKEICVTCGACTKDCISQNIVIEDQKAIVRRETCLLCGHCIAICPQNAIEMTDYPMEDVTEYNNNSYDIEPERLLNFIRFRRSVRQFKRKPVEDDKILKIIEAGRYTATASNRQDVSYIVVRDKLPNLRRLALETLSETASLQAQLNPALSGLAQRWQMNLESDKEVPGKNDVLFYNAPIVLLLASDSPVDAALAASNMELMAVAQGLGVFYCGFFVRAAQGNEEIKSLLDLENAREVKVCLVLGYPDVNYVRTVPRKLAVINWR